jgi:membrane glycosyltransferase
MFIGSPAWIGLLVLATIALVTCDSAASLVRADAGRALFVWVLIMWFSPKIASAIDLLLRPDLRGAFGGVARFIVNFAIETVYSILLCPILWISHAIFLVGLLFNREIGWIGQVRDDHAVPFGLALASLWPQTLIGCAALALVGATQPAALPYVALLAGGPALAVPFAMMTAWPSLSRLATRIGIGRLPEETATPKELLSLSLPAIQSVVRPAVPGSV